MMLGVVCFLVFFDVLSSVCCKMTENVTDNNMMSLLAQDIKERSYFPDSYRDGVYKGKLSPSCVKAYHRMYVTKELPARNYAYFHESETQRFSGDNDTDMELQWRIVGGHQVDIRQAPYAVMYGLYCGGTLIAPDWVLTAAHCKTQDNFVIAGSTTQFDAKRYPICSHFLHPNWNMTHKLHFHDFDYQLLLLEYPIPVTPFSMPISIGHVNDIRGGALVTISGWGHTEPKQRQMQNVIRQVAVPIITHQVCQALPHKYYQTITPRMFCAGFLGSGGKDSCQGDSGGPAVVNRKLVGLVSFGVGCAEQNQPGVYADIPLARHWIREITGLPL